ncbi:hypothetical protein ABL78_1417 [Leptomonas seymouri]|uniref:non-specific serine/threonine protein kinase n=1 Tax=Leptomonas seymouri TaxID=5684 RepID=A0A0N1IM49_LEPSE|nr:hypothetical protein ABL78_1417 [Leptomonas seymouri]|eukprot:KPI89453.1 hypothetical protein ABL78_1417 [Leptomonas seymouri]
MIRKKVLSIGSNSATLLVQDTEANGALRVLRRISVTGWCDDDVKMVEEMYETLRKARLRGFVPIHTVLVQNSFLSVVTSYASEGDLTNFLEDGVDNSLEEQTVLRWLCACAISICEMQKHKLYFPGLTTDRILLDHQTGGTAQILLGVPLPLPVYITQMQERRKNGVKVSLDYPPEVLEQPKWSFHATASDVWSLGRLGEVLLTAKGTGLARRSGSTRQLIARMMAQEAAKRPSMESVAQSLIAIAGNVKLGKPLWPAKMENTAATGSPSPKPSPAPLSDPLTAPKTHTPAPLPSSSNNSVSSPFRSSQASSPPPEVPATRSHDSRKKLDAGASGPPSILPPRSPPPPPPPPQQPAAHRDPASRLTHAPDNSWHRRAQHQFEQLQRLNASPQKSRNDGLVSPRGANADRRYNSTEGKSPSPRHGVRGSGGLDHNTRMLNEMFAGQEGLFREVNGDRQQRRTGNHVEDSQAEEIRQMKLETAQRQQEMRKHFTEWQRQNNQRYTDADNTVVMEHDGVMIVAPRLAPPIGQSHSNTAAAAGAVASPLISDKAGDSHSSPPTSLTSDERPNDAARVPLPTASAIPGQRSVSARGRKKSAPKTRPAASPSGLSPAAVPMRGSASPRPRPASQLSSVRPHVRESSDSGTRPTTSSADNVNSSERVAPPSSGLSRRASADTSTLSAVSWSVDGIRGTLRSLLRSRDLYGDVIQEVSVFVSQKEEARVSARANEIFMLRLRKLLPDDRLFYGAAPLCAQLVALEGLDHTLRNLLNARPAR